MADRHGAIVRTVVVSCDYSLVENGRWKSDGLCLPRSVAAENEANDANMIGDFSEPERDHEKLGDT